MIIFLAFNRNWKLLNLDGETRIFAPPTLAPSLANIIAVTLPMPVEAPVTRATLPSSLPGMLFLQGSQMVKSMLQREDTVREGNRMWRQRASKCLQSVSIR